MSTQETAPNLLRRIMATLQFTHEDMLAVQTLATRLEKQESPPSDEQIDAVCGPDRHKRWREDGRQYDRDTARLVLRAFSPPTTPAPSVAAAIADGAGIWRSCSGCHELNEGHDTGPYSPVFKCALGNGCSECGGLGAVWDTTDYGAMADFMHAAPKRAAVNVTVTVPGQAAPIASWSRDSAGALIDAPLTDPARIEARFAADDESSIETSEADARPFPGASA